MTVLLTYPRDRVPAQLRARLERSAPTLWLPLRRLVAVDVDEAGRRTMRGADRIVITSRFALQVYLERWWSPDWPGELLLLSRAMAAQARDAGARKVLVPAEENQRSLAALLRDSSVARDTAGAVRTVVLCGDVALPHDWLPASLPRIQVYANLWDADSQQRAADAVRAACAEGDGDGDDVRDRRIDRILVTSPSAYRRLRPIVAAAPECFDPSPTYYALGPSTEAAIVADGVGPVVAPADHTDVLRRTIERIIADEDG